MTREEIIKLARETGVEWLMHNQFYKDHLQHFAALVAATAKAEEREACAKVCEELLSMVSTGDEHMDGVLDCLAAIRARGQA